jgi:hypothetical protein
MRGRVEQAIEQSRGIHAGNNREGPAAAVRGMAEHRGETWIETPV